MNKMIGNVAIFGLVFVAWFAPVVGFDSPGVAQRKLNLMIRDAKKNPLSNAEVERLLGRIHPSLREDYQEVIAQRSKRKDVAKKDILKGDTRKDDEFSDEETKKDIIKGDDPQNNNEKKKLNTGLIIMQNRINAMPDKELRTLIEDLVIALNFDQDTASDFRLLASNMIEKKEGVDKDNIDDIDIMEVQREYVQNLNQNKQKSSTSDGDKKFELQNGQNNVTDSNVADSGEKTHVDKGVGDQNISVDDSGDKKTGEFFKALADYVETNAKQRSDYKIVALPKEFKEFSFSGTRFKSEAKMINDFFNGLQKYGKEQIDSYTFSKFFSLAYIYDITVVKEGFDSFFKMVSSLIHAAQSCDDYKNLQRIMAKGNLLLDTDIRQSNSTFSTPEQLKAIEIKNSKETIANSDGYKLFIQQLKKINEKVEECSNQNN